MEIIPCKENIPYVISACFRVWKILVNLATLSILSSQIKKCLAKFKKVDIFQIASTMGTYNWSYLCQYLSDLKSASGRLKINLCSPIWREEWNLYSPNVRKIRHGELASG